jgi:hypothetical protein
MMSPTVTFRRDVFCDGLPTVGPRAQFRSFDRQFSWLRVICNWIGAGRGRLSPVAHVELAGSQPLVRDVGREEVR